VLARDSRRLFNRELLLIYFAVVKMINSNLIDSSTAATNAASHTHKPCVNCDTFSYYVGKDKLRPIKIKSLNRLK